MSLIPISENFSVQEFVPRIIWNRYGPKAIWFVRPETVALAQFYREWFDTPVFINNWWWGGPRQNRGYRTPNTRVGSLYSQHKMGAAFDCNLKNLSPDRVRQEIMDNQAEFMEAGLTTLEDGAFAPTWIHSDIRPTGMDEILIVRP